VLKYIYPFIQIQSDKSQKVNNENASNSSHVIKHNQISIGQSKLSKVYLTLQL